MLSPKERALNGKRHKFFSYEIFLIDFFLIIWSMILFYGNDKEIEDKLIFNRPFNVTARMRRSAADVGPLIIIKQF